MKRVAYEWCGFACALLAGVTLAYIVASLVTDRTDFTLVLADSVQIRGANGQLNFSDALGNGQVIDDWDLSTIEPPVSSDLDATISGFGLRHITFTGGSTVWYVRLPLLFPFVILTILFVMCFTRVRKIRSVAAQQSAPAESGIHAGTPSG
jgi:hypothetical protein